MSAAPNPFADAARDRKANTIVAYLLRYLIHKLKEETDEGWIKILVSAEVKAERAPSPESKALIYEKLRRLERIHQCL